MFKKLLILVPKNTGSNSISYLSQDSDCKGKMCFQSTLRIDGKFEGEIEYPKSEPSFINEGVAEIHERTLVVGKSGVVKGKISVQVLIVEGRIEGEIYASERAEILSSATLVGLLVTPTVRVEEGAKVEAQINFDSKFLNEEEELQLQSNDRNVVQESVETKARSIMNLHSASTAV